MLFSFFLYTTIVHKTNYKYNKLVLFLITLYRVIKFRNNYVRFGYSFWFFGFISSEETDKTEDYLIQCNYLSVTVIVFIQNKLNIFKY